MELAKAKQGNEGKVGQSSREEGGREGLGAPAARAVRTAMMEPELVMLTVTACVVAAVLLAFAMVGCPVNEKASENVIQVSPAPGSVGNAEP